MTRGVLIPCNTQTIRYYIFWSLPMSASVQTSIYSALQPHLDINKMSKPFSDTRFSSPFRTGFKTGWRLWFCETGAKAPHRLPLSLLLALKSSQTLLPSYLFLDSPLKLVLDGMTIMFLWEHLGWNQFSSPLSISFAYCWKCCNSVIKNPFYLNLLDLALVYRRYVFSELLESNP